MYMHILMYTNIYTVQAIIFTLDMNIIYKQTHALAGTRIFYI